MKIKTIIISPYPEVDNIADLNEIKIEIRYMVESLNIQDALKISIG